MIKSNNYKVITVTTDLNGSVTGAVNNPGGVVMDWWDGQKTIGLRASNAPSKSNNGTVRTFKVLLNSAIRSSVTLTAMGAASFSPMDYSNFGFSSISFVNNKLTDISGLVLPNSCVNLFVNNNQLSGTFPTMPSNFNTINVSDNLYTSLPDFSYLNLTVLQISGNPLTTLPLFNKNTITTFSAAFLTGLTGAELDLSTKSSALTISVINISGSDVLPGKFILLALPTLNHIINGTLSCNHNAGLTNIINLSSLDMPSSTAATQFLANNCSLNITFPLGVSPRGIKTNTINIADNGMSSTNVDNTIDNWYTGLNNFNNTLNKTLFIGGTNAAVTGTYQMPSGFSYGISNGTPASQKEKIWVAVNQTVDGSGSGGTKKYKWTVTFN